MTQGRSYRVGLTYLAGELPGHDKQHIIRWNGKFYRWSGSREWYIDLRKPKGEIDMGNVGLSWDDGTWQPSHHRQGGPRCAILTEDPFALR
jgi:hypothetical protein